MRLRLAHLLSFVLLLAGCSAESGADFYPGASDGDGRYSGEGGTMGTPSTPAPSDPSTPSTPGGGGAAAGTLTAGAWDDNLNFERFQEFVNGAPEALPLTTAEQEAARDRFGGDREANATLDIALVIDTTGSMSDEIRYLQAELDAIAAAIDTAYPDASARWALIVYRDTTDEYVTRVFDFRSVAALRSDLAAQGASGGGDYPEASDAALTDMTNLAWREDETTARLAFWVADAPHHESRTAVITEAIRTASQLDVHIYPVASSGVDVRTETSMRSAAQLTGGRYLFLTDDSGVGGSHLEPSIPCYFVTLLSNAMLRMVDIEMSGVYREPEAAQIIRTGGDPTDRACTLDSGKIVYAF
ncbi:MAG: VWA domain-containing protein [Myxococcales bacterium]|nr:VWA domain-containing protein [Myxococcales bacterium]